MAFRLLSKQLMLLITLTVFVSSIIDAASRSRITKKIPPPAIPLQVNASDKTYSDKVRVNWRRVRGASSYKVFRCSDRGVNNCNRGFVDNSPPYDDTQTTAGQRYYYRVQSCNTSSCSNYSASNSGERKNLTPITTPVTTTLTEPAPPAPPQIPSYPSVRRVSSAYNVLNEGTYTFSGNVPSIGYIRFSWNPSNRATHYRIYACASTSYINCGYITHTQSPFIYELNQSQLDINYYFSIKSCNSAGCSDVSPVVTDILRTPIPSVPARPTTPTASFPDKIRIDWVAVDGAKIYEIYRCNNQSLAYYCPEISKTKFLSYDDYKANYNFDFYYRIKACNNGGCSNFSPYVIGRRKK